MSFVYLASPYSHPEEAVRHSRYLAACRKAAEYASQGISIFAPIAQSHPVADFMDEKLRMDFELWMRLDLPILRFASSLHVLTLDGWDKSRGVAREIAYANHVGIPVEYVNP